MLQGMIRAVFVAWVAGCGALEERVVRVLDGDTVELSSGDRLRLAGIDAPETGGCGAEDSTTYLRSLVLRLPLQVTNVGPRDRYGRRVAYLATAGRDVGGASVAAGWAKSDDRWSHPRSEAYDSFEREAASAAFGLWGRCW